MNTTTATTTTITNENLLDNDNQNKCCYCQHCHYQWSIEPCMNQLANCNWKSNVHHQHKPTYTTTYFYDHYDHEPIDSRCQWQIQKRFHPSFKSTTTMTMMMTTTTTTTTLSNTFSLWWWWPMLILIVLSIASVHGMLPLN